MSRGQGQKKGGEWQRAEHLRNEESEARFLKEKESTVCDLICSWEGWPFLNGHFPKPSVSGAELIAHLLNSRFCLTPWLCFDLRNKGLILFTLRTEHPPSIRWCSRNGGVEIGTVSFFRLFTFYFQDKQENTLCDKGYITGKSEVLPTYRGGIRGAKESFQGDAELGLYGWLEISHRDKREEVPGTRNSICKYLAV